MVHWDGRSPVTPPPLLKSRIARVPSPIQHPSRFDRPMQYQSEANSMFINNNFILIIISRSVEWKENDGYMALKSNCIEWEAKFLAYLDISERSGFCNCKAHFKCSRILQKSFKKSKNMMIYLMIPQIVAYCSMPYGHLDFGMCRNARPDTPNKNARSRLPGLQRSTYTNRSRKTFKIHMFGIELDNIIQICKM